MTGVAMLVGTLWVYILARRRSLVAWRTVVQAAGVWVVLVTAITALWLSYPPYHLPVLLLLGGICALVVSPLAAAPLTLAWNRTR
jgi:hypothetical protein